MRSQTHPAEGQRDSLLENWHHIFHVRAPLTAALHVPITSGLDVPVSGELTGLHCKTFDFFLGLHQWKNIHGNLAGPDSKHSRGKELQC